VWHRDPASGLDVLLVHRPKYDDWSLPKGKLDEGEDLLSCAVREVEEETGHRVHLDRQLPIQRYLAHGKPKEVHYWAARADPSPRPRDADAEIDKVAMVPVAEAIARVTHRYDADMITSLLRGPLETRTVIILRHAHAYDRTAWNGHDRERPLDSAGHAAAGQLVPALRALGVTRIVSSPAVRCRETVEPLATSLALPIDLDDGLSEEQFDADDGAAARSSAKSAGDGEVVVLCSHRPVLPTLMSTLDVDPAIVRGPRLALGAFVVLNHHDGVAAASHRYHI